MEMPFLEFLEPLAGPIIFLFCLVWFNSSFLWALLWVLATAALAAVIWVAYMAMYGVFLLIKLAVQVLSGASRSSTGNMERAQMPRKQKDAKENKPDAELDNEQAEMDDDKTEVDDDETEVDDDETKANNEEPEADDEEAVRKFEAYVQKLVAELMPRADKVAQEAAGA
jgi:hypothetical protein